VLRDVWLAVPQGGLTVMYGHTGSGKTSLLMALLGEILTREGASQRA
jgi:ABC-type branched-subunit amino acid transport system ATPase component